MLLAVDQDLEPIFLNFERFEKSLDLVSYLRPEPSSLLWSMIGQIIRIQPDLPSEFKVLDNLPIRWIMNPILATDLEFRKDFQGVELPGAAPFAL